ncbi:aspartyl protease family protein [Phenylobacterium sp.]|jgi:predicted aspartyl protease|uniref:aspartyl protease family protein n=1 Tax=Phenylobacterium sp. TaxID=1871053 RepID=UPI002F931E0B
MRRFAALFAVLALALAPAPASAQVRAPTVAPAKAHTVAFEFLAERQILFPITINGHRAEAWLDSGASATIVDAAFARQIGLPLGQTVTAQGVAGTVTGVRLSQAQVKIGDVGLPVRRVAVMDLSDVAAVVPRPVQVILGREAFQDAVVDIDFGSREISFTPRAEFRPPRQRPLRLRPSGALRSFPISIEGLKTEAILDLGNSGALLLDRDFAERQGLLRTRPTSTQLSVGADGARESLIASFDRVSVGGVRFDRVVGVATRGLATHAPANVGLEILSRFEVTIDFPGERLWLRPIPGAAERPFRKNRAGLSVAPAMDHIRVTHVAAGSPAQAAGWRVGDRIVAVNGQKADRTYAGSELSRWIYGPAGQTAELTLDDGSRRTLKLADYF